MEKSVTCLGSTDEMMTATAIISFVIYASCLDEYQANIRMSTRWIPPRSPVVMVLSCANERTWLVYRKSRAFGTQ
jgi:hypothetical protein